MKKVLSFVLVLSMILGSFGMAFAAAPADVVGKDYEDAVNVLTELEVIAGYKDGSFRPENVVTRAEMATFIVKALGLADYAVGKSEFSDMAGHWADPFVAYAVSLGFVKGNTDGTFAPNATVSYDQAITMLVQALGYKAEYLTGGYPGAFVNQAKTLGMLDGIVSGAAGANRGDVATLLYNTLNCQFVRYDKEGSLEYVEIRKDVPDNMMARLGATEYNAGDAFVLTESDPAAINVKEYLGAYVTAYQNSKDEIIAIEEVKSVFLFGDYDKSEMEFETEDMVYDVDVFGFEDEDGNAVTPSAFLNGRGTATDFATDADATDVAIAAKVSGKTIKAIYSVAKWDTTYGDTVLWDADYAEELAEDKVIDSAKFDQNDNKEIDTDAFLLVGADSLEDIPEDAVVTYYQANDTAAYITKVEVSTTVVEGKITKVNKDNDMFINGKYYPVASLLTDSDDVELAAEGKFFLNYAGEIVYAEAVSTEATDYAVVLDTADGSAGLNGVDAKVKLFLADGTAKTFVVDADAFHDGSAATTDGTIVAGDVTKGALVANVTKGAVIKYALNEDGEVEKIAATTTEGAATKSAISAKGTYEGRKIASNVVVFTTEAFGSTDADKYGVTTLDKILGQKDVVAHYITNASGDIVFMLVDLDGTTGTHKWAVVTDVAEMEDDLNEVTLLVGTEEKVYTADKTEFAKNCNKATLYAIDFDAKGYVVKATGLEAEDFAELVADDIATGGAVTKISANKIYKGDNDFVVTLDAGVIVYKWDAETNVYTVGKVSDIKGYENGVSFYDIDDDQVADIVTLEAAL